MTAFDHTSGASRFAARPNTVARLVQVASNLFKAFKNRREFYRLGECRTQNSPISGLPAPTFMSPTGDPLGIDPTSAPERHRAAARRRRRDRGALGLLNRSRRRPRFIPAPTGRLPIARSAKDRAFFVFAMAGRGE